MKRYSCLLITTACLGMFTGCASYRNNSRDHDIPVFRSPPLTIDGLKSPQTRTNQNPDIALALAISGGGHHAANLATGIMLGLEELKIPQSGRNMLEEVDYFSTVSGGGFAAGTYISSLYDHINNNASGKHRLHKSLNEDKERRLYNLRRDYQASANGSIGNVQVN